MSWMGTLLQIVGVFGLTASGDPLHPLTLAYETVYNCQHVEMYMDCHASGEKYTKRQIILVNEIEDAVKSCEATRDKLLASSRALLDKRRRERRGAEEAQAGILGRFRPFP